LCAVLTSLLAAGCSSGGTGDYAQYLKVMRAGLDSALGDGGITRNQAAAIPYASMGIRINGGNEAIIVLATQTDNDLLWTSAAHIVLVTRDGRIVRTVGLPAEMSNMAPQTGRALPAPGQALQGPYMDRRFGDFRDVGAYNIQIICRGMKKGPQAVTILGKRISTVLVEESCTSSQLRWSYRNSFWVDPESGFVWRSSQHIHPGGTVIETQIFRPPA
jgi:hypothetical protein